MITNKWFVAIFSIAILVALGFTVQGISANADLTETAASPQAALNTASARWTGEAGRAVAKAELAQRFDPAQAARLAALVEYYSDKSLKLRIAQSARLAAMSKDNIAGVLKSIPYRLPDYCPGRILFRHISEIAHRTIRPPGSNVKGVRSQSYPGKPLPGSAAQGYAGYPHSFCFGAALS